MDWMLHSRSCARSLTYMSWFISPGREDFQKRKRGLRGEWQQDVSRVTHLVHS